MGHRQVALEQIGGVPDFTSHIRAPAGFENGPVSGIAGSRDDQLEGGGRCSDALELML
jgi:hypothetical protein